MFIEGTGYLVTVYWGILYQKLKKEKQGGKQPGKRLEKRENYEEKKIDNKHRNIWTRTKDNPNSIFILIFINTMLRYLQVSRNFKSVHNP